MTTIDIAQFHQVYFEESLEHLAQMESSLLRFDGSEADPELINIIFRGAHSIKGGAGTFGFQQLADFTHLAETLLERVRSGGTEMTSDTVALLLDTVDVLREMISALKQDVEFDISHMNPVRERLQEMLSGRSGAPATVNTEKPRDTDSGVSTAARIWRIRFAPFTQLFKTGNDPCRMMKELSALGYVDVTVDASRLPNITDMDPEECYLSWEAVLRSEAPRAAIEEVFAWVEGDCELDIQEIVDSGQVDIETSRTSRDTDRQMQPKGPTHDRRAGADRRNNADRRAINTDSESIRVNTDKIDALINMVGELVITQSMLSQISEGMESIGASGLEKLRDGLAQLERNTRELQEGVMRIRMLPISFSFSRFPRLVHDISQKLNKKIDLKLAGEQTELDKTVMEKIGDPLVHLVRNAIDHGIEPPEERAAQGKPAIGTVMLDAYHQGGNVVIRVSDDGAGLDKERILAKAREKGLVDDDDQLNDDQIHSLIFEPGFSTAVAVSDLSGRGVGMDVVRRNIRDLGGSIDIASEMGKGSCFTIKLPLTLSILDGQLVRVGAQTYITPLISIVESLQIIPQRLNVIAGRGEVYKLRDDYISIMRLQEHFEMKASSGDISEKLLVVVEAEGRKVGLMVDELLGQQQVVIKSLDSNFRSVPGISGATILGDGMVSLILDTSGLVQMSCGGRKGNNAVAAGKCGAAA